MRIKLQLVLVGCCVLKDEFKRLMDLFSQGSEGKTVQLEEVFKEALVFFEHLNLQLKEGSPDDKKEALMMMSEMYTKMMQETKKICEKTGMSEEQLASYAENPSNFSPEQWRSIQEARNQMLFAGQNLVKSIGSLDSGPNKPATPPTSPKKEAEEKKGPPGKKTKRSQWMRS